MGGVNHSEVPNGYNKVATYMGAFPSLALFRRFLTLNAKNLLCMQAELINHDYALRRTIKKDREAGEKSVRSRFEFDISALKGPHETPGDSLQWKRTLELRRLLKDYSESSQYLSSYLFNVFALTRNDTCIR